MISGFIYKYCKGKKNIKIIFKYAKSNLIIKKIKYN